MAVQRQSEAVEFGKVSGPQIQGAQVGTARADVGKFYDPTGSQVSRDSSFMDGLLKIIAPAANKLASTAMTVGQDEAYLRGSAAAGTGKAEAEVESNFMTKGWATAGYRDTTTRLKAADAEAQTALDMQRLREQSPAEFAKYLAARRDNLYSDVAGMSREGRKSMLTQQLVSERAAIKNHAVEHQKFIIDQSMKAAAVGVSGTYDALDKAKGDPENYTLATTNAYANLLANVWQNPSLPEDARVKATAEAMQAALSRNHQGLFLMFKNQSATMPDGSTGTMFSRLPFDEQIKLTKAFDSSMDTTKHIRAVEFDMQVGLMTAQWDDPNAPAMPESDLKAFIADGLQRDFISRSDVRGWYDKWASANAKKVDSSQTAADYQSGNVQALFNKGKNDAEGYQAWEHQQTVAKRPVEQVVGDALNIGVKTGSLSAFKGVGVLTRNAVAQLGLTKEGPDANASMLNTVLKQLDRAEQAGHAGAVSAYMSSFSDDDRAKLMYFRESLQSNGDPQTSAAIAMTAMVDNAKIDPKTRDAMAATRAKEDSEMVNSVAPRDLFGTMSSVVTSWFSEAGSNRRAIGTGRMWFEDEERVNKVLAGTKLALGEELTYISRAHPNASAAGREKLALAAVASRTVMTDSGPLVIPRLLKGTSLQSYFGVPISTMPDTIGQAISEKFKPLTPDNRTAFRATTGGELRFEEFNSAGALVRSGTFDPKSVREVVADKERVRAAKFNATDGMGLSKQGPDGYTVTYNGNSNVVGLRTEDMLEFRNNLVKMEGVRGTPYDDASGKVVDGKKVQTVGVGVSSHNKFYPKPGPDGRITPQALDTAFAQASSEAAEAGQRLAAQYNLGRANKNAGFLLMSELAYQSGPAFAEKSYYKDFTAAVGKKDKAATIAAFKKTPAWENSHPQRREHYLDLINKSME